MIEARYTTPEHDAVSIRLEEGDTLGGVTGTDQIALRMPAPGNREYEALAALVKQGDLVIVDYVAPAAPVPNVISDRQFAQALALDGRITQAEALAWAARGELPEAMQDALAQIPEADAQRFGAHMMLAAATTYELDLPLTSRFGALLGYDADTLADLWSRAAVL